jgi:GT2 family glycosyltransferase
MSLSIGFVFTNYNNSRLSIQCVDSIIKNRGDCKTSIVLIDNASKEDERAILRHWEGGGDCETIWNDVNLGYFAGLNVGIDHLLGKGQEYDVVIIGNNDLVFDELFFFELRRNISLISLRSVVCPAIRTLDNEHQNPHVIDGISRLREVIWDLYFSNFYLSRVIHKLAQLMKGFVTRRDFTLHANEGPIYQGYGACYILTPLFFSRYHRLWSPGFVMGEEFYLARQLAAGGEKMYYLPKILVHHHDHATVSKVPSRLLWEMSKEFHGIYRFFISPYRMRMDNGKNPNDFNAIEVNGGGE